MKRLLCLLAALCLLPAVPALAGGGEMTLLAINVGKADCLLLRYGEAAYLIDTGAWESWGAVSAALKTQGVTRLDGVILTHTDKDHAGGMLALAQSSVRVDAWYASAYYCEVTEKKHPAVLAAALRGEEVRWIKAGDSLPFGDGTLDVIGPTQFFADKENNNSVVLMARAAGASMLLAGDQEEPAEQLLLRSGVSLKADVLKVGHHGEGDATGAAFAQAVSPKVAVISTNSVAEPDTPSNRVLKVLKALGTSVALTENAAGGVLVTASNGSARAEFAAWENLPATASGVAVTAKDNEADIVTVTNRGSAAVDLTDWYLCSQRGGEIFVFPAGCVLQPGQSLTVGSRAKGSAGDLIWPDKNVGNDSKDDEAVLCDAYGRVMDRAE